MKVSTLVLLIVLLFPAVASPQIDPRKRQRSRGGQVTVPLSHWSKLQEMVQRRGRVVTPAAFTYLERSIDGVFRKGLLRATLVARFEVLEETGHVRVPVLDRAAFIGKALLQGKPTTLAREHEMYTIGVDRPGIYTVTVTFFVGREQERFSRRLKVRLPPGGITRLSILVPEREIEARLAHGALSARNRRADGTLLVGNLDATGIVDLTWTRRLSHKSSAAVRMEARLSTLFTVREALISAVAVFDLSILEGETDRLDLRLPAGVEVLRVTGDAVLQWQTQPAPGKGGTLVVLLRYLARGDTRVAVHYQYPSAASHAVGKVGLLMVLPSKGVTLSGAAGVQAPAGLAVRVVDRAGAKILSPGDLPLELTDLTQSPLILGFRFTRPPRLALTVSRHEQVRLTSTLIDDLQAATVLTLQGGENTKVRLNIRNNTRQYLTVRLPDQARLTHALIDGRPVRPAQGEGRALLFPLRQSERIEPDRGRVHKVKQGETLGDIAYFYYSDPGKWSQLLEANRHQLHDERSLRVGQELRVPSVGPVKVEESSFVLEIAYRRRLSPLGSFGHARLQLPELDVDVMRISWHLYVPTTLVPLSFDTDLTQYSAIRYGPFRRALDFLKMVFSGHQAWAGSGETYTSILSQRKQIYMAEAERRGRGEAAPANFPLVGERYRFKRILAGKSRATIVVTYASQLVTTGLRWGAMLLALALALHLLGPRRRWWSWIIAAVAVGLLLALAHHVPGVHRRMVWGVALGVSVAIYRLYRERPRSRWLRDLLWSPWTLLSLGTVRNLVISIGAFGVLWFILHYPLLLSSVSTLVLLVWWRRQGRASRPSSSQNDSEVAHADA